MAALHAHWWPKAGDQQLWIDHKPQPQPQPLQPPEPPRADHAPKQAPTPPDIRQRNEEAALKDWMRDAPSDHRHREYDTGGCTIETDPTPVMDPTTPTKSKPVDHESAPTLVPPSPAAQIQVRQTTTTEPLSLGGPTDQEGPYLVLRRPPDQELGPVSQGASDPPTATTAAEHHDTATDNPDTPDLAPKKDRAPAAPVVPAALATTKKAPAPAKPVPTQQTDDILLSEFLDIVEQAEDG